MDALAAVVCGPDALAPKVERRLGRLFAQARRPLAKLCDATRPRQRRRLRRSALRRLDRLVNVVERLSGGKVPAECAQGIADGIAPVRQVVELASPLTESPAVRLL